MFSPLAERQEQCKLLAESARLVRETLRLSAHGAALDPPTQAQAVFGQESRPKAPSRADITSIGLQVAMSGSMLQPLESSMSETDIFASSNGYFKANSSVHMNMVKYSAILALIGNAVMMMRSRVIIFFARARTTSWVFRVRVKTALRCHGQKQHS